MAANELTPDQIKKEKKLASILAWRQANPEKVKAYQAKYCQTEKGKQTLREKEKRRIGSRNEQHKQYDAAHRAQRNAASERWRKEHPEQFKAITARTRERNRHKFSIASPEVQKQVRDASAEYLRRYRSTPAKRMLTLFHGASARARNRGLELEIELKKKLMAEPPVACPCCSLPFDYAVKKGLLMDRAPSLDRFDPAKGYTVANVKVLCWRCNMLKNNAKPEELEAVVAYMRRG